MLRIKRLYFFMVFIAACLCSCGRKDIGHTVYSGDEVYFGAYEQDNVIPNGLEPIKWIVLSASDKEAVLLSSQILEFSVFKEINPSVENNVVWNNSFIRSWLNNEFLNMAFSEEEVSCIKTISLKNDPNPIEGLYESEDTLDKVYLLSFSELAEYGFCDSIEYSGSTGTERLEEYFKTLRKIPEKENIYRRCSATAYACAKIGELLKEDFITSDGSKSYNWWLRSKGSEKNYIGTVTDEGVVNVEGNLVSSQYIGIRPLITVDLCSGVFSNIDQNLKSLQHIEKMTSETPKSFLEVLDKSSIEDVELNTVVTFGKYQQSNISSIKEMPIEWIVDSKSDDTIRLISKYVIDYRSFNESKGNCSWDESTLNKWLNTEFKFSAFNEIEQGYICGKISLPLFDNMISAELGYDVNYLEYDVNRTAAATDYTVLLYQQEHPDNQEYNKLIMDWTVVYYYTREMTPSFGYWLQDVDDKKTESALKIGIKGDVETRYMTDKNGVRPQIIVKIK